MTTTGTEPGFDAHTLDLWVHGMSQDLSSIKIQQARHLGRFGLIHELIDELDEDLKARIDSLDRKLDQILELLRTP